MNPVVSPLSSSAKKDHGLLLASRIHACWLGKSIGGTLGLPHEGKMERLNLTFYDPIPLVAPPNDDLELQLVWLEMVEKAESTLSLSDFAKGWLDHIHYMWDEYGRCRWNLRRGVPVESVGTFENHFHAGMGSPIRSEIWACLFPGDPDSASYYATLDASLDHGTEGIAGEVFFVAMQSLVASGTDLKSAIATAMRYLPDVCETAIAIEFIDKNHRAGMAEWDCWKKLLDQHGNANFTHAPLNVALTVWALLYGEQDFEKSILLATNGGYDTDCTAATVGATLGLILGIQGIPSRWSKPIGEGVFVGPGIRDLAAPKNLTELTERTAALIGKLERKKWDPAFWTKAAPVVRIENLPGTIQLTPFGANASIPWANGELPEEMKRAGGGQWIWKVATDESREIICLVRAGAKLFIDGSLVAECPAGLPYVPATHRSPNGSRVSIRAGKGNHLMELALGSSASQQEATVILAYPDLHIAPWTPKELPARAVLPTPKP